MNSASRDGFAITEGPSGRVLCVDLELASANQKTIFCLVEVDPEDVSEALISYGPIEKMSLFDSVEFSQDSESKWQHNDPFDQGLIHPRIFFSRLAIGQYEIAFAQASVWKAIFIGSDEAWLLVDNEHVAQVSTLIRHLRENSKKNAEILRITEKLRKYL